jgi:uncharacterized membrane protein
MSDKTLKWALLISLMINAAIGGFIVAQFLRPRPLFMAFGHMPTPRPEISDKMRAVLDAAFAAERPSFEKAISDMVQARDKSVSLLRANPLDLQALDEELAKTRAANSEAQESFHRVVHAAAQQLDPAGRELLSEILKHAPPGNVGPHGPLGPPGDAPWRRKSSNGLIFPPAGPTVNPAPGGAPR